MKAAILSAVFMLGVATQGVAQAPSPEGLVWMAIRDINAVYDDDAEPMNRPPVTMRPPEGMICAVDVSHDGRPDWLVDYEPSGVNRFCGTGGCLRRLYVSVDDQDYVQVMDAQVLSLAFGKGPGEATVTAEVHPILCQDRDPCFLAWRWDGDARALIPVPAADGRPVAESDFTLLTPRPASDQD